MKNFILSICIPTWNRCDLLALLLLNISKEIYGLDNIVEVVVSDNASTDQTKKIVSEAPIKVVYDCQKETVGFAKNLLHATTTLATGEFIWVIGDDDLLLPGSIKRVLKSIATARDVDYHYANFGWIDTKLRENIIVKLGGVPPAPTLKNLQCDDLEWRLLSRIEDLAFIPGKNPSSLFSGIFCFIVRRSIFIQNKDTIKPSDSLDGTSTELSDAFPHAMLTLPYLAGHPIAYIGTPTVMQGVGGWEWSPQASKIMIRSTYDLLVWLETTNFAKDALERLRASYAEMAGLYFAKMLIFPEENKGSEQVLPQAIPSAITSHGFWKSFMEYSRRENDRDTENKIIKAHLKSALAEQKAPSIGIWGYSRFRIDYFDNTENIKDIKWIGDSDSSLEDYSVPKTSIKITQPRTMTDACINILILGVNLSLVETLTAESIKMLPPGVKIVSVMGVRSS